MFNLSNYLFRSFKMSKFIKYSLGLLLLISTIIQADVKVASTTSTQNSGFYDYALPILQEKIGEEIQVIAVGTGRALNLGENGDVDLVIVHAPAKEKEFVAAGHGEDRRPFMYNQFVIVGPESDPAGVKTAKTAAEALSKIAESQAKFASRGDNSGTHFKEQALWKAANITPEGDWYMETGSGMGATLNTAASTDAYSLSDSSTWLKFNNKQNLVTLFKGDPVLYNQYSVMLVPKSKYPHVNDAGAKKIADWLVSEEGQAAINAYQINGEQAFTANAGDSSAQ